MSFFDTLKSMGLFPNQDAPAQGGGDYTAGNPYGLDPAMLNQARWASLGNIGTQLLALGQQMRPQDRAQMMGGMDLTGGLQQNLLNAAQMKLAQRRMMADDLSMQQAYDARQAIAEKIKALPKGQLRDAAMFYLTAGDTDKAAEVLYKTERRINPETGQFENVYSFDQSPVGGAAVTAGGGYSPGAPSAGGGGATPSAPSSASSGPLPVPPAGGTVSVGGTSAGGVDRLTANWRRITGDPTLTPEEAKQISMEAVSKNDPAAGIALYREMQKQKQTQENSRFGNQQSLVTNFLAAPEVQAYNTLQQTLSSLSGAVNDNTHVNDLDFVYGVAKALDPNSVVRESEGQMVIDSQGMAPSLLGRIQALVGNGALTPQARLELYNLVKRRAEQYHATAAARRDYFTQMGRGVLGPEGMPNLLPLPADPQVVVAPPSGGGGGPRRQQNGGNPPPVVFDGQGG